MRYEMLQEEDILITETTSMHGLESLRTMFGQITQICCCTTVRGSATKMAAEC